MENLTDIWRASVQRFPDRVALVGRKERYTYQEVDRLIDAAAARLGELGVGPGSKVALFVPNDPGFVVAFFAVLKAGGVLCHIDAHLSTREMSRIFGLLRPDLAIVGDIGDAEADFVRGELPTVQMAGCRLVAGASEASVATPDPEIEGVAGLFFTSGTTGLPKAVMLTHRNLIENTHALQKHGAWIDHEVFGNPLPVWHISGAMVLSLVPLSMGATVVYMRRTTPETILRTVEREGITRFGGVPHIYALLNRYPYRDRYDVSCCRSWISGGAPLPEVVENEFHVKYKARIRHVYGMLEASPCMASTLDERDDRFGVVGRALPGVSIEIRDDNGEVLPAGADGEVWVTGPNIMKGYYGNPDATARAVVDGWLDTGDIGQLQNGDTLILSGRHKEMMIVAGKNVYPTEIETVLLSDDQLSDAAVVSREDPLRGEEILAFVVPSSGVEVDAPALRSLCVRELASYKVPRSILLVDRIPRSDTGKIRRAELLQSLAAEEAS